MTGAVLLGVRMYMDEEENKSSNSNSTALALLNTRDIHGYKSVTEMLKPKSTMPWGNQFAFLHMPMPKLNDTHNSLDFVFQTHRTIKRLKTNYAAFLTAQLLAVSHKLIGPEVCNPIHEQA